LSDLSQVIHVPVRRIELGFSFDDAARIASDLREHVPGIAVEATRRIEKELPEFARPHDPAYAEALGLGVEYAIGQFLDLMADPGADSTRVLEFWRRVGADEASAGRTLYGWQAATLIGAGVAIERLAEQAETLGYQTDAATVAGVANAVFGYLNQLAVVAAQGHADAEARAANAHHDSRQSLLNLLLSEPFPELKELRELAYKADWLLPRTVAAVALRERGPDARRPVLSPDVLLGLHLPDPCLIVPDPEGPGRSQLLEQQLRGWTAAIGPTMEITELAKSLRWAQCALDLSDQGLIDATKPIAAEMHMPIIVMMQERELVEKVINRRLAPLLSVRSGQRHRLAETLLTSLECGFNTHEVAARLHVHAQTVRNRIRRLEELFGDAIHTASRLELHMAVQAWLTLNAEPLADQPRRG
jgi:hypothetical protein